MHIHNDTVQRESSKMDDLVMYPSLILSSCTFAPATIALVISANVKRNPNPNPNLHLYHYPTSNQKANRYPHSNSLLSEM